jgi:hypothetical protein
MFHVKRWRWWRGGGWSPAARGDLSFARALFDDVVRASRAPFCFFVS